MSRNRSNRKNRKPKLTEEQREQVVKLRQAGVSILEIAKRFQLTPRQITGLLNKSSSVYLPTPDEIRKRCLEIQEGWTPEERQRRMVHELPPVMVRIIRQDRRYNGRRPGAV